MPGARHDFRCALCGFILRDHQGARPFTAPAFNPCCPMHQFPLGGVRMEWLPFSRFSGFSDSGRAGPSSIAKFSLPIEDPGSPSGFREVTVGGLSDIRRLERESERLEANGEGRRMVWRDYSQDRSNADAHTLAPDPSVAPPKRFLNGTPVRVQRGEAVQQSHGDLDSAPSAGPDTLSGLSPSP